MTEGHNIPKYYVCEGGVENYSHSIRTHPISFGSKCPDCGNSEMRLVDWDRLMPGETKEEFKKRTGLLKGLTEEDYERMLRLPG